MPDDPPAREADIVRSAMARLRELLPDTWSIRYLELKRTDRGLDAVFELTDPERASVRLLVQAKRSVGVRDLPTIVSRMEEYGARIDEPSVPVVAAPYLADPTRRWLEDHGVGYADATGNVHLATDRPALFVRDRGADKDPWRGPGRPRDTLTGPSAAAVVRALVDFAPPITVPELARRSGTSIGATYRVVDLLERDALIERDPRAPIRAVEWRRLLERWSQDYGFQQSNTVQQYLHPRGLSHVLTGLAGTDAEYAITGSLSAHRFVSYADARLAMLYVDEPDRLADELGLRPVDGGANVLVAASDYAVVLDRTARTDGLTYAAPSQTAVDLLTGPGRSPSEGHALLDWMETHEPAWRRH